jgi:hypothetical protein
LPLCSIAVCLLLFVIKRIMLAIQLVLAINGTVTIRLVWRTCYFSIILSQWWMGINWRLRRNRRYMAFIITSHCLSPTDWSPFASDLQHQVQIAHRQRYSIATWQLGGDDTIVLVCATIRKLLLAIIWNKALLVG